MDSRILSAEHAKASGVDEQWQEGNEQWWDWYLSLAADDGAPTDLLEVAPPAPVALPTLEQLREELAAPYPLTDAQSERFRADGYLKVPDVLTAGALALARSEVERLAAAGDGPGTSGFLSLDLMWQGDSDVLELFALSPRLGRLAADLLGVADTRIYHDNVLSKTPGCGRTPWHFDDHHFPIDSRAVATVWLPLQQTPRQMGPLSFARGVDLHRLVDGVPFSTTDASYDRAVSAAFAQGDVSVEDGPFELGEISVHSSLCFHTAGPNRTSAPRMVLATTYFADGARVVPNPTLVSGEWQQFLPGAAPGEVIDTPMNPVASR